MGTNVNPTITADTATTPINLTALRPVPLRPAIRPRIDLLFSAMVNFSRLNKKLHHYIQTCTFKLVFLSWDDPPSVIALAKSSYAA
jgi:hypothetical protein